MTNAFVTTIELDAYDASRSCLISYTREFSDATWGKTAASVTANSTTAADNQMLADTLVENSVNTTHFISKGATSDATVPHIFSVFVKASGSRDIQLTVFGANPANYFRANFNLTTGVASSLVVGGTGVISTAYSVRYSNNWFRCVLVGTPQVAAGGSISCQANLLSGGASSYLGDGVSGVYLDRALLETGSTLGDPIDIGAYVGPGIKKLYYTDAENLVTSGSDTPPHQSFEKRIIELPNFIRRAFGDTRVLTTGQSNGGLIKLTNIDGELSSLLDLGLDGRDVTLRVGQQGAAYPSGFSVWIKGTVDQPEISDTECTLRLRDRMALLDLPLQSVKYAGTNSGGPLSGAEGIATDIKGLPKPQCWGRCYHVPAIHVNTNYRTYQVHNGQVQAIDAVYDMGFALTPGANYANLAALEAAVPGANTFITCTALGLFRLGSAPVGVVTADVRGDAAGSYVDRPGAIARRILETIVGVGSDINTTSFSNLDTAANYECGIWFGAETTRRAALTMALNSVGAWALPTAAGVWTAGQLISPSGTAAATLTNAEIINIERLATNDSGAGIPAGEVLLRHTRYWHPFSASDITGSVSAATRAELLQPWRRSQGVSASTKLAHLLFTTIERDSYLTVAANADTEQARLLSLYSVRRDFVKLRTWFRSGYTSLEPGSIVDVYTSRLGYSAGRKFVVIGVGQEAEYLDLELWG